MILRIHRLPMVIMTMDAQIVMTAFAHGDLSTILSERLQTRLLPVTPDFNATQTAAAETATRAPRPDPLLLTATAIARQ